MGDVIKLPPRKGPLTGEEMSQIRKLRRQNPNITSKEVGWIMGRASSTIAKWALSVGVPFKNARGPIAERSRGPMSDELREKIRQGQLRRRAEQNA